MPSGTSYTVERRAALLSLAAGLRAAASRPGLLVVVWALQLIVAAAAALPLFRALSAVTASFPEADRLLERFSLALYAELLQANQVPMFAMLQASGFGVVLIAVITGPAFLAAIVTSLERPGGPKGALAASVGRYYWPLLRLTVFGRLVAIMAAGLVGGAFGAALRPLRRSLWEAGRLASGPLIVAVALVVLVLFWAVVDYAIVHAIRTESRRMFAAWRAGVRAAFRRLWTTLGIWFGIGLLLAACAAIVVFLHGILPATSAALIAAVIVLQQIFIITRIGLRVALLGAEAAAWRPIQNSEFRIPDSELVRPEEHERPGQDRERQVQQREDTEHPVEREQVQDDRARDGHHLRDREARADAQGVHVVLDQRVPLPDAERHDSEISEYAVENLGAEEDDQDNVAEPAAGSRRGGDGD